MRKQNAKWGSRIDRGELKWVPQATHMLGWPCVMKQHLWLIFWCFQLTGLKMTTLLWIQYNWQSEFYIYWTLRRYTQGLKLNGDHNVKLYLSIQPVETTGQLNVCALILLDTLYFFTFLTWKTQSWWEHIYWGHLHRFQKMLFSCKIF